MQQPTDFYELVYGPELLKPIILKKFPQATFEDARDEVHRERFAVTIPNCDKDKFYPFAIKEGFIRNCFGFELEFASLGFPGKEEVKERTKQKIDAWIEASKKGN